MSLILSTAIKTISSIGSHWAAAEVEAANAKAEAANSVYLAERKEVHQGRTLQGDVGAILNDLWAANYRLDWAQDKFGVVTDANLDAFAAVARKIGGYFEREEATWKRTSETGGIQSGKSEPYKELKAFVQPADDYSTLSEKLVHTLWDYDRGLKKIGFKGVVAVEEEFGRLFPKTTDTNRSHFDRYQLDYHLTEVLLAITERLACDKKRAPEVIELATGALRHGALDHHNAAALRIINAATNAAIAEDKPRTVKALAKAEEKSRFLGGYSTHSRHQTVAYNLDCVQGFVAKAIRHMPSFKEIRRAVYG